MMTKHDQTVLTVAKDLLTKGDPEIEIGEKVKSRVKICLKLKELFPDKKIMTTVFGYKVRFSGGRVVVMQRSADAIY